MATRKQLMANVARGVALLDEKDSGWWNGGDGMSKPMIGGMVGHIDLGTLNLLNCNACILGKRYQYGSNHYEGALVALGLTPQQGYAYGFNIQDDSDRAVSAWTELWVSVIKSRRSPHSVSARDPWVREVNKTWVRKVAA